MTGPSTNFYVGPQKKHYTIPKRLLYQFSDYAKPCLEGPFLEASANAVFLSDVDPDVFQYLWQWLYTGMLKIPQSNVWDWEGRRDEKYPEACRLFCQLHFLGERLLFDFRFLELVVQDEFEKYIAKANSDQKMMAWSPELVEEVLSESRPVVYGQSNLKAPSLRPFVLEYFRTFECCTTLDFMDYAECFEKDGEFAAEIIIYLASEIKWAKERWEAQVGGPVDVFRNQEQATEGEGSPQCIASSSKLTEGIWAVLRRLCTSAECSATEIRGLSSLFEMDGEFTAEFINHLATELLLTIERWGEEKGEKVDFVAEREEGERLKQEAEDLKRFVDKIMRRDGWS